jgi:hypothetical protein
MVELVEDLAFDAGLEENLVRSPVIALKSNHRSFHRVLQREILTSRVPEHNHRLLVDRFLLGGVVRLVVELGVHEAPADGSRAEVGREFQCNPQRFERGNLHQWVPIVTKTHRVEEDIGSEEDLSGRRVWDHKGVSGHHRSGHHRSFIHGPHPQVAAQSNVPQIF